MAISKDFIVFVTMLLVLVVTSSATRIIATQAEINAPFGCNEVDTSSKLVATYSSPRYGDYLCGKTYSITCLGDGSGGDSSNGNPCNGGDDNFVTVTMVGECTQDCDGDIQLSTDIYDSIVGVEDSDSISVEFLPVYNGP